MPELIEHAMPLTDGLLPTGQLRERLAVALAEVDLLRRAIRLAERRDREKVRLAQMLAPHRRGVAHAQA